MKNGRELRTVQGHSLILRGGRSCEWSFTLAWLLMFVTACWRAWTRGDKLLFSKRVLTSEAALIGHIVAVDARRKEFVFEGFSLAEWLAPTLQDTGDAFIVSHPCQNALISRAQKSPGGCLQPVPPAAVG